MNGKAVLNKETELYLKQFDNEILELNLKKKGSQRTSSQNAKYWKLLDVVADQTGYSKGDLHELLRDRFLGTEVFYIKGIEVNRIKHTPETTTKEFGEYYTQCEIFCKEFFDIKFD